jgi:hypothetical protein
MQIAGGSNLDDYYEVLQISPKAEQLVITKVYRLLAAYYHPDNKQTGNEERFKLVLRAYEILSDPAKRSVYNLEFFGQDSSQARSTRAPHPSPDRPTPSAQAPVVSAFAERESHNGEDGGSERELRKALLRILYDVRRNTPGNPEVSLLVLSELLGCGIDSLEFSTWYLKEKGLIKVSESADFCITVAGVDHVEREMEARESGKQPLSLPEWQR